MRRRDFVTLLASATAWLATARAQEPGRTIGVLGSASYGAFPGAEPAFIQGLKATGFLEGENISIEWRWAEGQYNRLSSEAAELVDRNVAVIVAFDVPRRLQQRRQPKTS
jgi:putative tryptophan/tyrosine transport system substrate-binding protein